MLKPLNGLQHVQFKYILILGMERYEGKIDNVAKYLSLKMLFIEKKGLECYKVHTSDHEFERCQ